MRRISARRIPHPTEEEEKLAWEGIAKQLLKQIPIYMYRYFGNIIIGDEVYFYVPKWMLQNKIWTFNDLALQNTHWASKCDGNIFSLRIIVLQFKLPCQRENLEIQSYTKSNLKFIINQRHISQTVAVMGCCMKINRHTKRPLYVDI